MARSAMWPHKILTVLLYGEFAWLSREDGVVHGSLGPMAKQLRLRKYDLVRYLKWLESQHLLQGLTLHDTHFFLRISPPVGWEQAVAHR